MIVSVLVLLAIAVVGLTTLSQSSGKAVTHAVVLAQGLRVPPFLIGLTLASVGTDIPEIANSIVASLAGQGDLNVGDSVGSVAAQATLILGLLPLAGGAFVVGPGRIGAATGLTLIALAIGAFLVADGFLSRFDAAFLVAIWIVSIALIWRHAPPQSEPVLVVSSTSKWKHAAIAALMFIFVAAGATAVVYALTEIAKLLQIPLYLISFFGASVGTSLPELAVDISAVRNGKHDIAIGNIFGACLIDATLSIAAGPLIAPTAVTASLAVPGAITAAIVMGVAGLIVGLRRNHDRKSGIFLLCLYAATYYVVLLP